MRYIIYICMFIFVLSKYSHAQVYTPRVNNPRNDDAACLEALARGPHDEAALYLGALSALYLEDRRTAQEIERSPQKYSNRFVARLME